MRGNNVADIRSLPTTSTYRDAWDKVYDPKAKGKPRPRKKVK